MNEITDITSIPFEREIVFSTSRSSGPGGQHVNKVSTKIELRFNIPASKLLTVEQKGIILERLKNRITDEGTLIIISQASRSQAKNKKTALEKFFRLIENALKPLKSRIATQPSASSKEKRLEDKRKVAYRKEHRKPPQE
jgi:ribosome-associated protein